jgi:hypothetical protein
MQRASMLAVDQGSIQNGQSQLPEAGSAVLNPRRWFPGVCQFEQLGSIGVTDAIFMTDSI